MKRRSFSKLIAMTGATIMFKNAWTNPLKKLQAANIDLPEPIRNNHSVEICLNSRVSTHGGYSGNLNNQILANALWAASKPPCVGSSRIIYAATPDGVYQYDSGNHRLIAHKDGNQLSEPELAFEIGVATEPAGVAEDAGIALHWAQLASVAFWGSSSGQVVCCPKDSGYENANQKWNPASDIHIVNCYGKMSTVGEFKSNLVASSSDNSLPAVSTDGSMVLEDAVREPLFGASFDEGDLTLNQISQIAWASYGCTPHSISSKAGLTTASWNASYYMTGRIYIVTSDAVQRYHMRQPSGATNTHDHRIEKLTSGNRVTQLRNSVDRISRSAPVYFVFCADSIDRPRLIEAGYCGSSALLQATALNLQGHYCAAFNPAEQTAVQSALGIPSTDKPLLIFAAGKPSNTSARIHEQYSQFKLEAQPNPFFKHTEIVFSLVSPQKVDVVVYNTEGKHIRTLVEKSLQKGNHKIIWDGSDYCGKFAPSGTYVCNVNIAGKGKTILLHKK